MKNPTRIDRLIPVLIATALFFALISPGIAQDGAATPPAATNAQPPQTGDATTPQSPATDNNLSDDVDDYDSSGEPFGRGCPYNDDDLELVS